MRKWIAGILLLGLGLGILPMGAWGLTYDPVAVGRKVQYINPDGLDPGYGPHGGGEFYIDVVGYGTTPYDFLTFCVEKQEYITIGGTYVIADISDKAVKGGTSTSDPLDAKTAYLYYHFRVGDLMVDPDNNPETVNTVAYSSAYEGSLQLAIWYIEEEIASLTDPAALNFVAQATAAVESGSWIGLGPVRVLNLQTLSGGAAQDCLTVVPEPATILLLGGGFLGTALAARRTKRRGRSRRLD